MAEGKCEARGEAAAHGPARDVGERIVVDLGLRELNAPADGDVIAVADDGGEADLRRGAIGAEPRRRVRRVVRAEPRYAGVEARWSA